MDFNDFTGLLVISWIFIYLFNYSLSGILSFFYERNKIKINFKQKQWTQ
jgi:hypothetical protein